MSQRLIMRTVVVALLYLVSSGTTAHAAVGAKATHPRSAELPAQPAELKRIAPGVFELTILHHDFALIVVEQRVAGASSFSERTTTGAGCSNHTRGN